jgi:4-hydroxybenzoate polyprenyltransferase
MKFSPNIVKRTNDWWKPKAGNILAVLYIAALQFSLDFYGFFASLVPAIITIFGIGLFAYCINDWVDLPTDMKLNKKNMFLDFSISKRTAFLLFTVLLALTPWILLPYSKYTIYFLGLEFVLILIYSLPPIRLKTKGFLGALADSAYAYAIPASLAYYTFSLLALSENRKIELDILILFIWQLFSGLYNIAIHQMEDFSNDKQSLTNTWAIKIGKKKLKTTTIV